MPVGSAMREQTMDEILASIHRMITDGNVAASSSAASAPEEQAEPADDMAATIGEDADGWMAAQVAAVLGESVREALDGASPRRGEEPLERKVGRRFVDGFAAGTEDVALIDGARRRVETKMSEHQRAPVVPVRPEPAARPVGEPPARPAAGAGRGAAEDRLMSEPAAGAAAESFDMLSRTILSQNPRTLEDLVRDLLRPMLRSWLDQNLPRMVERMVRQEIERISRGER